MTEADATARALEGPTPPAERSDRVMWGHVAGASLISTALGAYEIAPASVTPLIRESMGIGATAPGLLDGGFGIQLMIGLSFTYDRELVSPEVAATAVALQAAVGTGGAFVTPIAGGSVIDAAGYTVAFLGAAALAAVGIGLAWWAPEPG